VFYSYDWLENLAGCNIHSSNRILQSGPAVVRASTTRA
jgi:hypothetical protein